MDDFTAARLTMAISLGFHIILAAIGMVMPFLMAAAHRRWLKTGDPDAYRLTRMWMRGVAIFFATGAVSGTALSFELGILWPTFMEHAGPIFGMPFSLEGAAFFVEAIALGIYMYGWKRISPRVHWWVGVVVGIAGLSSGILVISANGWMNSPTGFTWDGTAAHDIDPVAALLNPAWATQSTHMVLASFEAVGFAVAGVHAYLMHRHPMDRIHGHGLRIALAMGAIAALLQPLNGHWAAQDVAERQPAKLAAMEAHFHTEANAPLLIGGIPDEETQSVSWGIEVPSALSVLAFNDPDAEVQGLEEFPRDEWPPVLIVHFAFQIMVGIGSWLALLGLLGLIAIRWKPHWLKAAWFRRSLVLSIPLGFVAIEAGWVVTEVGRQPWIIHGIMRTQDALTPVPGQVWHLVAFTALYAFIGLSTLWMWRKQLQNASAVGPPSEAIEAWARPGRDG
ncbi:MAG: cytochrome ubiquinol oxidase subunit I [Myxococcota bacterium]